MESDYGHLLWNTFVFPSEELELHSISPAIILTLIVHAEATHFSTPITLTLLRNQIFRLQVDGGANHSVTNNRDTLHVLWDISPYYIGGIGIWIRCTAKCVFHLLCGNDLVLPVTM